MGNFTLAHRNRADEATLTGGTWDATLARANLSDPDVDVPARSTGATRAATRFRFALPQARLMRAMALHNCNLSEAARVRFRAGLAEYDLDFTTGVIDDRLTCTSDTDGTTIDSSGAIVAAGATGRIYHDPALLDNGCYPSEDMTGTGWAGVSGGQVVDASTIVLPAGGSVQQSGLIGFMPSVGYNVSCLARVVSGTASAIKVALHDGAVDHTSTSTGYDVGAEWELLTQGIATNSGAGTSATNGKIIIYNAGSTEVVLQVKKWQVSGGDAGSAGLAMLTDANGNRNYRKTTSARLQRCLGLLREPARTQLLAATATLTSAGGVWSADVNTTENGVSGTLLGLPAYSITAADSTGVALTQSKAVSSSANYVLSFLCDKKTADTGGAGFRVYFDDGAGGSGATYTSLGGSFTELLIAPGVYLITGVFTTSAAQTRCIFYAGLVNPTAGFTFRIAAPQLEAGADRSSYIPNIGGSGTTAPRTADSASATGLAAFSQGTLYEEARSLDAAGAVFSVSYATSLRDAASTSHVSLRSSHASGGVYVAPITVNSGVTQSDGPDILVPAHVSYRLALSFAANDFRFCVNGVAGVADTSGTVDSDLTVIDLAFSANIPSVLARAVISRNTLTNDQLDALTTSGPGAIGYDSGWMNALQFSFAGDTPTDWSSKGDYSVMACASANFLARYGTVEVDDTGNAAGYVQIGRLFMGEAIEFAVNPDTQGWADGRQDLSTLAETPHGKFYAQARPRPRTKRFAFAKLTVAEANALDEMIAAAGTVSEVLVLPDPDDMEISQRWGGLGTLRTLSAIEWPTTDVHTTSAFEWRAKQ
jgi:hypothetical protein